MTQQDSALAEVQLSARGQEVNGDAGSAVLSFARKRAVDLLRAMGVERVVWVDDQHASTGSPDSIDEVQQAAQEVDLRPLLLETTTEFAVPFDPALDPDDGDTVSAWIGDNWKDFNNSLRERLTLVARRADDLGEATPELSEGQREDDLNAIPVLDLFDDEDIDLIPMRLSEWRERGRELLEEPPSALVLVDLDFTAEGYPADAGEQVLLDVLQQGPGNTVAAIFSHNVKDEDDERRYAADFAQRHSIAVGRIAAIGKFRQRGDNSLPEALRVLFFAEELEEYRALAAEAFAKAHADAQSRLERLHRYTLLSSIDAGITEGDYELDVPLRIVTNGLRRALTSATRVDARAIGILDRLRDNDARAAYVAAGTVNEEVHRVLWEDAFDDPAQLHLLNLPIDVGDIFETFAVGPGRSKKRSRWILLAQACDLTVRSNGRRAWELPTLTLTELVKMPVKPAAYIHELGPIDGDQTRWAVNVVSRIHAPSKSVDATVFGGGGISVLPAAPPVAPVSIGWELRRANANAKAEGWIAEYASATKLLNNSTESGDKQLPARRIASALTGAAMNLDEGVPVHIDAGAGTISYGIRRIGRVSAQKANYLFGLAHGYLSRPADAADLATVPAPLFLRP